METWFVLKLLLSFLVGGLYIAFVIRVSERVSAGVGGILAGMPTTVLISTFFIWWVQGTESVSAAIPMIVMGIGASVLFLTVFLFGYRTNRYISFVAGAACWLVPLLYAIGTDLDLPLAILIGGCCLIPAFVYFRRVPNRKANSGILSRRELLFRVCFAGSIIALAVSLSRLAGGQWGGLITSFPAASLSGLVLVIRKHGVDFAASMARGVPYGIVCNIGFLATLSLLIPLIGFPGAILLSLCLSCLTAVLMYSLFLRSAD